MNQECQAIDADIKKKRKRFVNLKKKDDEMRMEHDFLESQVGAAELNQFKLGNRKDELSENIRSLRNEIEVQETERKQNQEEADAQ